MAITERQKPGSYYSAHNPLWYVVESDNTAQPNFKFIFEVFIDAVKVATVKVWPKPGTIYGVFDASEVVSSYLNNLNFSSTTTFATTITDDGYFSKAVTVKYGEEHGSPVTSYLNLANSGAITVYNYVNNLSHIATPNQLTDFQNKFLSENKTFYARLTDYVFYTYFKTSGGTTSFSCKKYDEAGTQIGSTMTSFYSTIVPIKLINVGAVVINSISPGYIDSNVSYYEVYTSTDIIRVYLDCFSLYTNYHLVYMNRLGGWESFWFSGKASKTMNVNRKTFGKNSYDLSSFNMINNETGQQGVLRGNEQTNRVSFKYSHRLTSRFLTDAEFEYLAQLVSSPVIYLQIVDRNSTVPYYLPVKITQSNYEMKTQNINGVSCLELEIELLNDFKNQSA